MNCMSQGSTQLGSYNVDKIILKGSTKKDSRAFVQTSLVCTCDDLKDLIRKQLYHEIIPEDFCIRYMEGSTVVMIRSCEDISEFWASLSNTNKIKVDLGDDKYQLLRRRKSGSCIKKKKCKRLWTI